jgi:hypothetical protein
VVLEISEMATLVEVSRNHPVMSVIASKPKLSWFRAVAIFSPLKRV